MSDAPATPPAPRPVSLLATAIVFILLGVFWVVAVRVYVPGRPPAPQNEAPDNLPKDLAWKATPALRKAALLDLRKAQATQAVSYGWIDRGTGTVQLPIGRAMELIVQENAKH
jgi:hypothetical protein